MQHSHSHQLYQAALKVIPGGVNSPVRAFNGVGGEPVFFKRGMGAYLFDEDGNKYIDYVASWGPLILGHAHPAVVQAVQAAVAEGLGFGAPTALEVTMAKRICELMPSIQKVRMVNSGTEATMSAIRLARGVTGRDIIVKFEGCYHGHGDSLLVKAGSGALTLGVPTSPGVPAALAALTLTLEYNNSAQVEQLFRTMGGQIAAVIVEPVAGNMNCVPPEAGFLATLRVVCTQYDALLIFDEVMTGFRVALGGAQALYQIKPDLTTLGKVIGAGMPVGAFGGRADIMDQLAPLGPVYQAGTLSGNPVAMTAGLVNLDLISEPGFYEALSAKTQYLMQGLTELGQMYKIPISTHSVGAMFGIFFSKEKDIRRFSQVMNCDIERFKRFFHGMLAAGVYLAPSAFETGFVSSAHSDVEINNTLSAAEQVLRTII